MSSARKTVIIGGGISGLAAAHYLCGDVTVIEARPKLGGVLQTEYIEGCIVECGADAWLASKPWAADLVRELGLETELIGSNDAERRTYIWRNGHMVAFPEGMQLVSPTRYLPILKSDLIGPSTKFRMVQDWFRKPDRKPARERTIGALIADHFGVEAVDYIAEPLLSGIYGGDPFELSADAILPKLVERERKYGSLTRGAKVTRSEGPLFQTVRGGLGKLIDALTPASVIHARAEAIEPNRVRVNGDWIEADRIVVACETWEAAKLLPEFPELAAIRHSSTAAISLGFRREDVAHPLDGFGFLVPKREGRKLAACTWMNTKFPHRVAEGYALLRCFIAETRAHDITLMETARTELGETMGITAEPQFHTVSRWPRSLPLYTVGHQRRIQELEHKLKRRPDLRIIGSAFHGVGIPDCIRLAFQLR